MFRELCRQQSPNAYGESEFTAIQSFQGVGGPDTSSGGCLHHRHFKRAVVGINPDRMVRDLKQILGDTVVSEPAAFLLESPHGRSLVVFYAIGAGTAMTGSTTLRAYQLSGNRAKLTGVTGGDIDGYGNLWVKKLTSPQLYHERWLLVGGQAFGANGANIQMRGYAYDGEKFATKWMPANVWGTFTVTLTGPGFRVDGPYYQDDKQRHDEYLVAEDGGLYLCRPRQCD